MPAPHMLTRLWSSGSGERRASTKRLIFCIIVRTTALRPGLMTFYVFGRPLLFRSGHRRCHFHRSVATSPIPSSKRCVSALVLNAKSALRHRVIHNHHHHPRIRRQQSRWKLSTSLEWTRTAPGRINLAECAIR